MRFLSLKEQLKDFTVFSLSDIRMVDASFLRRRLNEWQDKGYIRKIIRGYYMFSDVATSEPVFYEIANRIYEPSYVSFETALAHYGLFPESAYGIVSASTRKTSRFATSLGAFSYRTVMKRAFFGYTIAEYGGRHFKIAEAEKALLDYLYLHADMTSDADFEAMRINPDVFHSTVDGDKLTQYAEHIGQKQLFKRTAELRRYMKNA
jgi:predicted transcriptional regulator of viral defense system